jgi:hypothetical protein
MRGSLRTRFYAKFTEVPNGCWLWTGAKNEEGYGSLGVRAGRSRSAHRISWEIHHGSIPDGFLVCHACDTPSCVNPAHLFIGTHRDNAQDKVRKRRCRPVRGERNGHAVLTASDVASIRALREQGVFLRVIAPRFGVSISCINHVMRGDTWKHAE